jgi:hypothetical protein
MGKKDSAAIRDKRHGVSSSWVISARVRSCYEMARTVCRLSHSNGILTIYCMRVDKDGCDSNAALLLWNCPEGVIKRRAVEQNCRSIHR